MDNDVIVYEKTIALGDDIKELIAHIHNTFNSSSGWTVGMTKVVIKEDGSRKLVVPLKKIENLYEDSVEKHKI